MAKAQLKLKQVLPFIDWGITIRIYDQVSVNGDQWEIVFEGPVYEIPWIYTDRNLIDTYDNDRSEAMCPYVNEKGQACLRITLADEEVIKNERQRNCLCAL